MQRKRGWWKEEENRERGREDSLWYSNSPFSSFLFLIKIWIGRVDCSIHQEERRSNHP